MILRQFLAAATATAIITMPTMSAALPAPSERQSDADICRECRWVWFGGRLAPGLARGGARRIAFLRTHGGLPKYACCSRPLGGATTLPGAAACGDSGFLCANIGLAMRQANAGPLKPVRQGQVLSLVLHSVQGRS